jgi:hypothetical protein
MAAVSTSRRSLAGIILAIAGALLLINAVLGFAAVTALGAWPTTLAYLAIGVAFLILAISSFRNTLARIALVVAAVGFLLLALGAVVALPSPVGTIAWIAAAVGTLVAAIVLYVGKEITNLSAIAFIATAVIFVIIVFAPLLGLALGTFGAVLALLFALGVLVTGIMFARVQGERGR